MSRFKFSFSVLLIVVFCGMLFLRNDLIRRVNAQEDDIAEEQRGDEFERDEVDPEAFERRLNEIEQLIDKAKRIDDDERVNELRREGERLLDRLEEFERAQDAEDDEGDEEREFEQHIREIEIQRLTLEIERLHQEIDRARQESAIRWATIVKDKHASASYALTQAVDAFEDENEMVEFLVESMNQTKDGFVRRMIQFRLARLYAQTDQHDKARQEFRKLILAD